MLWTRSREIQGSNPDCDGQLVSYIGRDPHYFKVWDMFSEEPFKYFEKRKK